MKLPNIKLPKISFRGITIPRIKFCRPSIAGVKSAFARSLRSLRSIPIPKRIILPPRKNAVVPVQRVYTLRQIARFILNFAFILVGLGAFLIVQAMLGQMVVFKSTDLIVFLTLITLMAIVLVTSKDIRWRIFILVMVVLTMSGDNLQRQFGGSSKTSTFVMEYMMSWAFLGFVLLDLVIRRHKYYPPRIAMVSIFLFALSFALAVAFQPELLSEKASEGAAMQPFFAMALMIGSFLFLDKWVKLEYLRRVMLGGVLFFSVLGFIEYFFKGPYFRIYEMVFHTSKTQVSFSYDFNRISGPYNGAGGFGIWLALFLPLAIHGVIFAANSNKKFWAWVYLGIICFAIFLTGSRTPAAQAILSALLVIFLCGNRRVAIAGFIFMVLLGGIMKAYGPTIAASLPDHNMFQRLLGQTSDTKDQLATFKVRQEIWRTAIERWREHPAFGIGPGNWSLEAFFRATSSVRKEVTHNGYVQTLVERGAFGMFAFLFLAYAFFTTGLKAIYACEPGRRRGLAVAYFSSFAGIWLAMIPEPGINGMRYMYVCILMWGILLKIPHLAKEEEAKELELVESKTMGLKRLPAQIPERIAG